MKFGELKQGNAVYILKKDELVVTEGQVRSVSFPHVGSTGSAMGMVVDVAIEADGKTATYAIPDGLTVTYTGSLAIATDRQALATEVQQMKQDAEKVLASVDRHKKVIGMADELLADLNPAIRERQETERRFSSIENSVNGLKGMVQSLLDKLA